MAKSEVNRQDFLLYASLLHRSTSIPSYIQGVSKRPDRIQMLISLKIMYEKQNCKNMLAGTNIKFLFQVLKLTNYMLQGTAKRPDGFDVLVSLNNL
jgi:hypothetical protein